MDSASGFGAGVAKRLAGELKCTPALRDLGLPPDQRIRSGIITPLPKAFANRARLPEASVLKAVVDTVEQVDKFWWSLPEREVVPAKILERMDAHIRMMTPILSTFAN